MAHGDGTKGSTRLHQPPQIHINYGGRTHVYDRGREHAAAKQAGRPLVAYLSEEYKLPYASVQRGLRACQ